MDREGESPLHLVAGYSGKLEMVRYLLENGGANVNLKSKGWKRKTHGTPLQQAVIYARADIVEYLLSQKNCDARARDGAGQTPLHEAVIEGLIAGNRSEKERILRLLIPRSKVNDNHKGKIYTPFQRACSDGSLWAVKILLEQKDKLKWCENMEDGE